MTNLATYNKNQKGFIWFLVIICLSTLAISLKYNYFDDYKYLCMYSLLYVIICNQWITHNKLRHLWTHKNNYHETPKNLQILSMHGMRRKNTNTTPMRNMHNMPTNKTKKRTKWHKYTQEDLLEKTEQTNLNHQKKKTNGNK